MSCSTSASSPSRSSAAEPRNPRACSRAAVELLLDTLLLGPALLVLARTLLPLFVAFRELAIALGDRALGVGQNALKTIELGREISALLLQPGELLFALVAGLGEGDTQTLDLGRCERVLFLQAAQVLLVLCLRLGESCFEPLDVGGEPFLVGRGRSQALELRGRPLVLVAQPGQHPLVLGLCLGEGALELLDVDQQPLLLARAGTRIGESTFEALDLGLQLLELREVGLEALRLRAWLSLGCLVVHAVRVEPPGRGVRDLLRFLGNVGLDDLLGLGIRGPFVVFLGDRRLRAVAGFRRLDRRGVLPHGRRDGSRRQSELRNPGRRFRALGRLIGERRRVRSRTRS